MATWWTPTGPYDFNPRSREGSDHLPPGCGQGHAYFNPRSREGSDFRQSVLWVNVGNFNPRSREGSDHQAIALAGSPLRFQSTLP